MSETTSGRLLELLSLLQARRDWPGRELAERLEVSRRTVRRDVERLRRLGYPVESLPGPAGGYRLAAGAAMPPLLLDDDEAIAIAVGLRTAAGSSVTGIEETALRALVKLEQVLPAHLRRRVSALGRATVTLGMGGGPTADPQILSILAAACRDGERVRFLYRGRDGAESRREVEPHSLVSAVRRWYLVAWDRAREDWRTFRVDRIAEPSLTGVRAQPRELPAADGAAFVARSLREAPRRWQARLVVEAPAEEVARARGVGGRVTPLGERRCELLIGDEDLDWLALRIAMLDADYTLEGPPELLERLGLLARRLERAVGG
jgi:predicted DNA-binding transcriptional regulator YafY